MLPILIVLVIVLYNEGYYSLLAVWMLWEVLLLLSQIGRDR
jgi:hypothetical protein